MVRRWGVRFLFVLPFLLIMLAWWYSASSYDWMNYGRGRVRAGGGLNEGVLFFDLFCSTTPFAAGFKGRHEARSPAAFWPPASAPAPAHIWQGLGYLFRRFFDGWQLRVCLPFWFLLVLLYGSAGYVLHRIRRARRAPGGFAVQPAPPSAGVVASG